MNTQPNNERLIRLDEVLQRIPVSKSMWFLGIKKGMFPKPVKIGQRAIAWHESEINKIVEEGVK